MRDASWHKKHMKKLAKREAIRKGHTFKYRMFQGHSIQMSEAERKFKEAQARELQTIMSKNWFVRQYIKLKLQIIRIWQKLNLKK